MLTTTVTALLAVAVVLGGERPPDVRENRFGDGVSYSGEVGDSKPTAPATRSTRRSRPRGASPPSFRAYSPRVGFAADEPCLRYDTTTFPTQESATAANLAAEERWLALSDTYALCPGVTRPPTAAVPTPGEVAQQFWGEIPLPKPAPRIAPGYAITGKRAFLETNGVLAQPFTRETPLGTLTLETRGTYTVDWGDGTTTGPHDYEGTPWPEGRISHVYTHRGAVTVRVTEAWEATWQLAGQSGTLAGLSTQAAIADFPIQEVQAVRTR